MCDWSVSDWTVSVWSGVRLVSVRLDSVSLVSASATASFFQIVLFYLLLHFSAYKIPTVDLSINRFQGNRSSATGQYLDKVLRGVDLPIYQVHVVSAMSAADTDDHECPFHTVISSVCHLYHCMSSSSSALRGSSD